MRRPLRQSQVPAGFDRAARSYDRLVAANPGYHRHLRRSARRLRLPGDGAGLRLLDLGCGTGASTAALLAVAPRARIVAVDASAGMLERARAKPWPSGVQFVHARAEELTEAGVEGPFDGILAAYLVRNLPDPDPTLAALRDLLRPGAALAVHEYSLTDSPVARAVWTTVCWAVVIPAGRALTGDAALYRYLWRSVVDFDRVADLTARLRRLGFADVHVAPMSGWQRGIVHTFVARRPAVTAASAASAAEPGPVDTTEESSGGPADGSHRTGPAAVPAPRLPGREGRDPRAVRHSTPGGSPTAGTPAPRVAVVGGGIAGVAAAVALAERGVDVDLVEREPWLGGRVGAWPTTLADGSRVTMSRGFHAFFGQYYNLRRLLRRVDPDLRGFSRLTDYPLVDADGHRDTFASLPRTPPLNAVAFALRSPTFALSDLPRLNAVAALPLADVRVPDIYHRLDQLDAATLLAQLRFPPAARHLAFSVFSRSFFAAPEQLSAAELATMFHLYFLGSSEGLPFDVPARPYSHALWEPMADYLRTLGVRLRLGTRVREVVRGDTLHCRLDGGDTLDADAVVLAADVAGLRALVAASPTLGDADWRGRVARLPSAPAFLVSRLWLACPVRPDRPAFLGTSGYGPLDNVSVLDRYEDEAHAWATRTGGSVVELHAYALPADHDLPAVQRELRAALGRVYPETRDAPVVDERHELHADSPLFPPGGFADRPTVRTPDPALVVAGDLTRVDHPVALMERAATSGLVAANALLAGWGVRGHDLWTVPVEGRSRLLRALARRAGVRRSPAG